MSLLQPRRGQTAAQCKLFKYTYVPAYNDSLWQLKLYYVHRYIYVETVKVLEYSHSQYKAVWNLNNTALTESLIETQSCLYVTLNENLSYC